MHAYVKLLESQWPKPPRHRPRRGQAPCPHRSDRIVDGIDSNVTADMSWTEENLDCPALSSGDSSGVRTMQRARTVVPKPWNDK